MKQPSPSRRSFLKTSVATAAAITASDSVAALHAAMPVHQGGGQLKIGIVGVGGPDERCAHTGNQSTLV